MELTLTFCPHTESREDDFRFSTTLARSLCLFLQFLLPLFLSRYSSAITNSRCTILIRRTDDTSYILIAREIEFRQLRVSRVKVNFATTLSLLLSPRPAESTSHRKTLRKRHNEGGGGEREATSDTRRQPPRPREKSRELTLLG